MGRRRIPDDQLTPEQLKRRKRNERYRMRSVSNPSELQIVTSEDNSILNNPSQKKDSVSKKTELDKSSQIDSIQSDSKTLDRRQPEDHRDESEGPSKTGGHDSARLQVVSIVTAPLLVVCCVLSYLLQVEVYESLEILPEIYLVGISIVHITAITVEVLLILLAVLMFAGRSLVERLAAGCLFCIIGGGTAAMMWHGQEVKLQSEVADIEKGESMDQAQHGLKKKLQADREALVDQRDVLLQQLDVNNPRGFAASGAIGLVNKSLAKLDVIENKIDGIDRRISQQTQSNTVAMEPKKSLMKRTTLFAEVFRLVLLFVTAFLVHVLIARIRPEAIRS